jgi:Fe-S-cluster containining protein
MSPPVSAPPPSPCDRCDARCCRVYVVPLTGDDAWRLSRATGVPLHRLVACAPQREPDGPGFLLAPGGPGHVLVLAAQACHPMAPCAFLREEGGIGRCGAYAARPRACRRFPAVRVGGGIAAREGTPCPPGAWSAAHLAGLSWRVALAREEREAALYGEVVADWNGRVNARGATTVLAWLDHLGETYAWLVRWRAALRPAERSGAAFLARVRYALATLPRD